MLFNLCLGMILSATNFKAYNNFLLLKSFFSAANFQALKNSNPLSLPLTPSPMLQTKFYYGTYFYELQRTYLPRTTTMRG